MIIKQVKWIISLRHLSKHLIVFDDALTIIFKHYLDDALLMNNVTIYELTLVCRLQQAGCFMTQAEWTKEEMNAEQPLC